MLTTSQILSNQPALILSVSGAKPTFCSCTSCVANSILLLLAPHEQTIPVHRQLRPSPQKVFSPALCIWQATPWSWNFYFARPHVLRTFLSSRHGEQRMILVGARVESRDIQSCLPQEAYGIRSAFRPEGSNHVCTIWRPTWAKTKTLLMAMTRREQPHLL